MSTFEISPDQIRQFEQDGYVIARGLFRQDEMDLLLKIARADRDMDKAHARKDATGGVSRLRLRNELYDDIYSAIVRSRRIVESTQTLLGDEVYHFHHKMMLKEPRVGGAWEWHQDYGYWYLEQRVLFPDMLSVAVAVDKATRENGCMQLIAGSHKCGRIDHGKTGDQTGAHMQQVEALLNFYKLPLVYAELEPGDALFFHSNTLHRSDANRSDNPRWTLICCYNTKHNDKYTDRDEGHPAYHPLEVWPDEKVLEVGRQQWEQMQQTAGAGSR